MQNMLDYYEWLRTRLGILTPLAAGLEGAKAGDVPEWSAQPSNPVLKSFISTACDIVNQHVGLTGSSSIQSYSVAAVTDTTLTGPLSIDMAALPGHRQRQVISIRRAWWNDGTSPVRLTPVVLSTLDARRDPYMADAAATPYRFATEGYTIFLDPAPSSAGTFQYMATTGTLAPQNDADCFAGIPGAYDPCVLYVALVEYGKSQPADAEMSLRAQAFTEDARAGLERLAVWFGNNNEEAQGQVMFDARPFRRNWYAGRR
jgi:hypothetical protein